MIEILSVLFENFEVQFLFTSFLMLLFIPIIRRYSV